MDLKTTTLLAKAGLLRAMAKHNKKSALQTVGAHAVNTGCWPSSLPRPEIGAWTFELLEQGACEFERMAKS